MASNLTRKNFFLPNVVIAALEEKADKTQTTMSEHVRAALIAYLKLDEKAVAASE